MEGFATGFAPAQATKPGFVLENDKFRVTFDGVSVRKFYFFLYVLKLGSALMV